MPGQIELQVQSYTIPDFCSLRAICADALKRAASPKPMVEAFDNVVFKLPIIVVHGPVKTQFGYHLIETIYRG